MEEILFQKFTAHEDDDNDVVVAAAAADDDRGTLRGYPASTITRERKKNAVDRPTRSSFRCRRYPPRCNPLADLNSFREPARVEYFAMLLGHSTGILLAGHKGSFRNMDRSWETRTVG